MVYRPGHDLVSQAHFRDRTCGLDIFVRELGTLAILTAAGCAIASVVGRRLIRRRAAAAGG
jgi:hypothetical protein